MKTTIRLVPWREALLNVEPSERSAEHPFDISDDPLAAADERSLLASCGVPERILRAMFTPGQDGPFRRGSHDRSVELADDVTAGGSLYLFGPRGTGKSHIAAAGMLGVLRGRLHSGAPRPASGLRWLEWGVLLEHLRREMRDDAQPTELDEACNADMLVLDDVGAIARTSPFAVDMVRYLMSSRWNSCRQTVVTSNWSPDELGGVMQRAGHDSALVDPIISRIVGIARDGAGVVEVRGRDQRVGPRS